MSFLLIESSYCKQRVDRFFVGVRVALRDVQREQETISSVDSVRAAFRIVGSASAVARAFGISAAATLKWLELSPKTGLPKIPPERCRLLEELTGGKVTREQLRPDVFGSAEMGA